MTITISNGLILIEDQWILDFLASTASIEILYKNNCGETVIVSPTISDFNDSNQYEITANEGIYFIQLNNLTTSEDQTSCVSYITEATKCKIVDLVSQDCDEELVSYYIALTLVNQCENCTCDNACKIYDEMKKLLENDCNC